MERNAPIKNPTVGGKGMLRCSANHRGNAVFTCKWKYGPLSNSFLSNCLCFWPVLDVDTDQRTRTPGVELKLVLQLFISAIALAAADLVCTEALLKIVHRVLSTTLVAAIVAQRKSITVLLTLVIGCLLSFTFNNRIFKGGYFLHSICGHFTSFMGLWWGED